MKQPISNNTNNTSHDAILLSPILPSTNDINTLPLTTSSSRHGSLSPNLVGNIWHEIEICTRNNTSADESSNIYVRNDSVLSNSMAAFDETEFAIEDKDTAKLNEWRLQNSCSVKTARLITKNPGRSNEDNPRNILSPSSSVNNYPYMHFASKDLLHNSDIAPSLPKRRPRSRIEIIENVRDAVCPTPETCVDSGIQTDQANSTGLPNLAVGLSTIWLPSLRHDGMNISKPNAVESSDRENVVPPLIPSNNNNNHMIMFNHLGVI